METVLPLKNIEAICSNKRNAELFLILQMRLLYPHLYKKERVRIAGVDTPEKRTRDLEEKALGLDATYWMKDKLTETIKGDEELTIRTELKGGVGKYGRLLGWLYVGDSTLSLNEQMITEGYAWEYDGGTKQKNFEELREIRRSLGSLVES